MTVDEMLNEMETEQISVQSDTPVCIIDPETRTITVPTEYQLLGVENDKRVERIYFQCPKIVGDNQDLSQNYQLFINYQNANGDLDAYHIDDMSVEEDNITFSWLLEENVTKYKGSIKFAFGAIKPGDEAEDPDKNRWNTTINTDCTCLIGLKSTQQVAESNPDALAQIWAAIDELKAGGGGSGTPGKDGVGIDRIEKTNTQGLVDTYTIYLTDDRTYTFTVTNGTKGEKGEKGDKGDKGDTGATPNIQIGTVQTLDPGQQATASMTGTPENPLLNLGIPKGGPASSGITVKTMQNTDTAATLPEETPYDLYIFPEMSELAVTIADANTDVHFFFDSGATATVFSLQAQDGGKIYTDAYSIDANMRYEVSVLHNVAYIKGVSTSET